MTTSTEKAALLAEIQAIRDEFNTHIRPRMIAWGPKWQAQRPLWPMVAFQNSLTAPINALTAGMADVEADVEALPVTDTPPPPPPPGDPIFTVPPSPIDFELGVAGEKTVTFKTDKGGAPVVTGPLPAGVTRSGVVFRYDGKGAEGSTVNEVEVL